MVIERANNEIVIRLPASVNVDDLQDFIDLARYKEITSEFQVSQDEVDQMATKVWSPATSISLMSS